MVVARVGRGGRGRTLADAGKLDGPADHTANGRLTSTGERPDGNQTRRQRAIEDASSLTMSELPLLFSFLWGGMGRRGASLFPSLRRRERSEFHGSKLDGGRNGGMTAFSLSLGSRVSGAPLLSWRRRRTEDRDDGDDGDSRGMCYHGGDETVLRLWSCSAVT